MYPVLIKIGPFTLYTYGLLVASGFLAGIAFMTRRARIEGMDQQKVLDLGFYLVLSAIIGSRLLYVIVNYPEYIHSPLRIFKMWEGGLVFYGGFIAAALTGFWYVRKHAMEPWRTADLAAPYLALGHSIGRLGCLFAGCCYGRPTDSWLAIVFDHPLSLAPTGIEIYPTQLFESAAEFSIFLILIAVRPHRRFQGQLFLMWMMLYSAARFVIEFYRGDERGYMIDEVLSTSQGIAIAVFGASIYLLYRFSRSSRE